VADYTSNAFEKSIKQRIYFKQRVIFQHKSGMMNKIDNGTAGTTSRAKSILILEQFHWHGWPQALLDKNLLCQRKKLENMLCVLS